MEIRLKIKLVVLWKTIILLGIIVLLSACFHSKKEAVSSIAIIPDEHTLLAITPEFSIKMAGNTLNKHYLRLKSGKIFPMTGILQVDGRTYRFMGEDSLRISPIASLANDSVSWSGKYSYLFPGKGWEQKEYGLIDELMPTSVHDIKTTGSYTVGKFKDHHQHLVYPYALMQNGSDVRTFEYNIVEFNKGGYVVDTYTETYVFNPERDIPILTNHCEEFIRFLEENRKLITDTKIFGNE